MHPHGLGAQAGRGAARSLDARYGRTRGPAADCQGLTRHADHRLLGLRRRAHARAGAGAGGRSLHREGHAAEPARRRGSGRDSGWRRGRGIHRRQHGPGRERGIDVAGRARPEACPARPAARQMDPIELGARPGPWPARQAGSRPQGGSVSRPAPHCSCPSKAATRSTSPGRPLPSIVAFAPPTPSSPTSTVRRPRSTPIRTSLLARRERA